MADSGMTLVSASVVLNRDCAKCKSLDLQSTTVFSSPEAFSLNSRTETAQVGVSKLGNTFRMTFLPLKSESFTSCRSDCVRWKSGALRPVLPSFQSYVGCSPYR